MIYANNIISRSELEAYIVFVLRIIFYQSDFAKFTFVVRIDKT